MDSKQPLVSFVMATQAKCPEYLRQAVASMLSQTFVDFEVVVVVDGVGIEAARRVLNSFPDCRLRSYFSTKQRGLARSLNLGVRLSKGELIARMDDDDRCLPDRLSRQVAFISESRCDVVGSLAWVIDEAGCRVSGPMLGEKSSFKLSPWNAVFGGIFVHPTVMMRRQWAINNRYNPNWERGQDRELWVRTSHYSRFGVIRAPLLEYRRPSFKKTVQLGNVRSAYRLILLHKARFGGWVPVLLLCNVVRHFKYLIMTRQP